VPKIKGSFRGKEVKRTIHTLALLPGNENAEGPQAVREASPRRKGAEIDGEDFMG